MKFCDEIIQNHLLNGGKIKRESCDFLMFLSNNGVLCYQSECHVHTCCITKKDLTADDWEIVEPKYDWDKIIKDKILCVFSDAKNYKKEEEVISLLISKDEDTDFYINSQGFQYKYCKPFNPADFNIAKDLKEYEK